MARRSSAVTRHPADLTPEAMKAGIERLRKRLGEVKDFDPGTVTEQYNIPHVQRLSAAINDALVRTFGTDSVDFERYRFASDFDNGPHNYAYEVPIFEVQRSLSRSKDKNAALIEQAIQSLEERLAESGFAEPVGPARAVEEFADNRRVFVVHGHAGAEQSVARFLEQIGFVPIILHEQANQGKTVIEKFEAHSDVGFAVVLLTDDDFGGTKNGPANPRARQNVILELGYFIGRLGRERVCALKHGIIELPSDILGVLWEELDAGGAWRMKLAKELQAAKYEIDWNVVMKA